MKWICNSMDQKLLSLVHGMWGVSYNFTNLYECVFLPEVILMK